MDTLSQKVDKVHPSINCNEVQSSIAAVRMSGSFSSGAGQNLNLSNNTEKNIKIKGSIVEEHHQGSAIQSQHRKNSNVGNTVTNFLKKTGDAAKNTISLLYDSATPSSRVNPFNREGHPSDDEDDTTSRSNCSEFTSTTSDGSGDISLAELGLTEDYFAHPTGLFGMSSVEELEVTIENCKKMILDLPEKSDRRKKYVKKLVELRMKLQELKEGSEEIEPRTKQVLSHKLRKKNSSSMKHYCDVCNNLIWGMLQVWYRCKECGFNCHSKCVNMIRRECIAVGIKNLNYILSIAPEVGLSNQQFHCAECKNHIAILGVGKEEARICDYNGQYYCPQCHWNDNMIIPARVLHNWDFAAQKVSRRSYQLLNRMRRRPLLNVQEVNPMLFNYVEELSDIRKLREDILLMKVYFTTCTAALEMKLLLKLKDRQHFVDGADMYSMVDLIEARDGSLTVHLTEIHASFAKHIKLDCMYCQAKGFICEICNSGETLFPFDFGVATCTKCHAVFHRDCFTCIDTLCPRCERQLKKKMQKIAPDTPSYDSDPGSDYLQDITRRERDHVLENHVSEGETSGKIGHSPSINISDDRIVREDESSEQRDRVASRPVSLSKEDSALKSLLSESSYSDYAVLGFAGTAKGKRASVPFVRDEMPCTSNDGADTLPYHIRDICVSHSSQRERLNDAESTGMFRMTESSERSLVAKTTVKKKEYRKSFTKQHRADGINDRIERSGTTDTWGKKSRQILPNNDELNQLSRGYSKPGSNPFINDFVVEHSSNPFEIGSNTNPFEGDDDYDESKNPFS